jgi:hypothetical protein
MHAAGTGAADDRRGDAASTDEMARSVTATPDHRSRAPERQTGWRRTRKRTHGAISDRRTALRDNVAKGLDLVRNVS